MRRTPAAYHARVDVAPPSRASLLAAFATVYVVWGSTYLAIRFAVESAPPHASAGARFVVAGLLLYAYAAARGSPRPSASRWAFDGVLGVLLLVGGNGPVVWAASRVPSGLTSLLVAMTPLWMMGIEALRTRTLPPPKPAVGVLAGLVGLALLVGGDGGYDADRADPLAALVLVGASLSWSIGSILARTRPPPSPLQSTGMQMMIGGALLFAMGALEGELATFALADVTPKSWWALVYLSLIGSVFGYSAYTYLLRHATAAAAATYAYVNPVVAVALGAAFADEIVTPRMAVAAAIIVASVALVVSSKR